MRRSFLALVLLCMLVLSGLSGAVTAGSSIDTSDIGAHDDVMGDVQGSVSVDSVREIRVPLHFGDVLKSEVEGYTQLHLEGSTGYLLSPGAPVLPLWSDILTVPVGSQVLDVTIENGQYYLFSTEETIVPAPEPLPIMFGFEPEPLYEGSEYSTNTLFPGEEIESRVTTGREGRDIVAHVFVRVFPMRYNPVTDQLVLLEEAEVVVRYVPPEVDGLAGRDANETYDVLVLVPEEWYNESLRYKVHKEAMGWRVKVVSLDDVYDDSIFNTSDGRDDAERIKYFIKQAIENWTVEHLLVIGDHDKFPIRRVRVEDIDGTSTPTDYYYGDIFEQGTTDLSDWNSDGDSYWGEARSSNKNADGCDLDPDIHVGRFPASTQADLEGMINKTIMYDENITTEEAYEWFANATFVGSDTFAGSAGGVAEGEYQLDNAADYIPDFNVTKFYETTATFNRNDIRDHINRGSGIMSFSDHGSAGGVVYPSVGGGPGLSSSVAAALVNGHKLPLSIQDACLTNRIDSSDSLGEHIILNPNGGGIGSFGATRIGWGMHDQWHIWGLSGYMGLHLVESYSLGHVMPAEMLDHTRKMYMANSFTSYIDFKTVTSYILFGDPIVFIGGPGIMLYPDNTTSWAKPGQEVVYNVEVHNRALHEDEVNISIIGGEWDYDLNRSKFHMEPNSTENISITFTVDEGALAYEFDNFTLSVQTDSIPFPTEEEFKTYVLAVRDVDIGVNWTEMTVVPGENVTLDFSIDNGGNVLENATVVFNGEIDGLVVNISMDDIKVDPLTVHDGNVSFDVPDPCLSGMYYFDLTIETDSSFSKSFFIKVKVDEVHGLDAYAIEDELVASGMADFRIFMENQGNHKDLFVVDIDGGEDDLEAWTNLLTVEMFPFQNSTGLVVTARAPDLAGEYWFSVNISSLSDPGIYVDIPLKVIVEEVSSISLDVTTGLLHADENGTDTFQLWVKSGSNFEENVSLSLLDMPEGWEWDLEMPDLLIGAFQETALNVTFKVPVDCLAGEYQVKVRANGKDSNDTITLTVVIDEAYGLETALDKDALELFYGETGALTLTINNTGNCKMTYMISMVGIVTPLFVQMSTPLVTLDADEEEEVGITVLTPGDGATMDADFSLKVIVWEDDDVNQELKVDVKLKQVPVTDLDFRYDSMSTVFQGDESQFTINIDNLGNVIEDLVGVPNESLSWNIRLGPDTTSLAPGSEDEVIVTFHVPGDRIAGIYIIKIVFTSPNGEWVVEHKVKVLATPTDDGGGGRSQQISENVDAIPYLLIILILIAALILVIAMAVRHKGGGDDNVPPQAPATHQGYEAPAPPSPTQEGAAPEEEEVTLLDVMWGDVDDMD